MSPKGSRKGTGHAYPTTFSLATFRGREEILLKKVAEGTSVERKAIPEQIVKL